jgi:hypothetical protein
MPLVEGKDQGQVMLPYPQSARELIELYYGRQIRARIQESSPTATTTPAIIGSWAQVRVEVIVSNTGSNPVNLTFGTVAAGTTGVQLSSGAWFSFSWRDDGELVMWPIYAAATTGTSQLYVCEYVLSPG